MPGLDRVRTQPAPDGLALPAGAADTASAGVAGVDEGAAGAAVTAVAAGRGDAAGCGAVRGHAVSPTRYHLSELALTTDAPAAGGAAVAADPGAAGDATVFRSAKAGVDPALAALAAHAAGAGGAAAVAAGGGAGAVGRPRVREQLQAGHRGRRKPRRHNGSHPAVRAAGAGQDVVAMIIAAEPGSSLPPVRQ